MQAAGGRDTRPASTAGTTSAGTITSTTGRRRKSGKNTGARTRSTHGSSDRPPAPRRARLDGQREVARNRGGAVAPLHFEHAGGPPFFPSADGRVFKTLEVPSTLPTLDETLAWPELATDEEQRHFFGEAVRGTEVHTIHAEVEGRSKFPLFAADPRRLDLRRDHLPDLSNSWRLNASPKKADPRASVDAHHPSRARRHRRHRLAAASAVQPHMIRVSGSLPRERQR